MNRETLPRPALLLGLAGLIPFAACAVATWLTPEPWHSLALAGLVAYGAVILSFLGAVHWGLALRATTGELWADWPRFGLGVVPALLGWVALLLPAVPGLALLAGGVLLTAAIESMATRIGLLPHAYLMLRWVLSIGAALCLAAGLAAA